MGLDIVELVMTVEEHFGVTIPDAEAQRILTVGELYVYLLERTRRDGRIPCPTSQAFYRLRRILTEELGVDRALVRPATQLRTLFPAGLRENALVWLADTLALPDLPDLDPAPRGPTGRSLKVAITWAAAAARLLSLLLFALWLFDPARPPVAIVFWVTLLAWAGATFVICLFFIVLWVDGRYLNPVPVPTVRDLVLRSAGQQFEHCLDQASLEPTPATIWADLVSIISTWSGVPSERIRPEQRWVDEFV